MLHFVNLTLSNPAKPDVKVMQVRALVTGEDFSMSVGPGIVEQLQLEKIDLREVTEVGTRNPRLLPYVGPLRLTYGAKEVFTGAINSSTGVAIGRQLALELRIDKKGLPKAEQKTGISDKKNQSHFIMVKKQIINPDTCRFICEYIASRKEQRTGVETVANSIMPNAKTYVSKKDHARDAYTIPIDDIRPMLDALFCRIVTEHIEPFFGVEAVWWEWPQLLSYERGGRYDPHVDGEYPVTKPGGKIEWQRHTDRHISLICYLNDSFTGGQLNFPDHNIKIQPVPGLIVAFPSTSAYRHGAEPVESGDRLAMVSWVTVAGSPRVKDKPGNVVFMKHVRNKA